MRFSHLVYTSRIPSFRAAPTWNIARRKISLSLTFHRGRFSRKKYELLIEGKRNFMLVYVTAHRYILRQRCFPLFVPRRVASVRYVNRADIPAHRHPHTLLFISFRFFFPLSGHFHKAPVVVGRLAEIRLARRRVKTTAANRFHRSRQIV